MTYENDLLNDRFLFALNQRSSRSTRCFLFAICDSASFVGLSEKILANTEKP